MNMKQLCKFLIKAKINTYASQGENGKMILSDGSNEFKFQEKTFSYRDRHFGFNPFIGEEIVWQSKKAAWGMNYYGKIIAKIIPAKNIYSFLQEALKKPNADKPFRGPANFRNGDLRYINKMQGTVKNFTGAETIFYKKQQIYQLIYHGGLIIIK
ncbi:MAG: DUF5680 domain-containing protein [Candidatus Falkowbacteria bacterium]